MVEARIGVAGLSLAEITEQHLTAQKAAADAMREWDERRAAGEVSSVAYASALLAVATEEAKARRIVMEYQPLDHQESIRKLTYISAFLIATEVKLEETEIAAVMEAATPFGCLRQRRSVRRRSGAAVERIALFAGPHSRQEPCHACPRHPGVHPSAGSVGTRLDYPEPGVGAVSLSHGFCR